MRRNARSDGPISTYVIADGGRIAAYFSLAVGQVDSLEAPDRIRKGMGRYPIPVVVLLARLVVALQDRGRGIGIGLLQEAIRRTVFIRCFAASH